MDLAINLGKLSKEDNFYLILTKIWIVNVKFWLMLLPLFN
jgi:hypothetical protein